MIVQDFRTCFNKFKVRASPLTFAAPAGGVCAHLDLYNSRIVELMGAARGGREHYGKFSGKSGGGPMQVFALRAHGLRTAHAHRQPASFGAAFNIASPRAPMRLTSRALHRSRSGRPHDQPKRRRCGDLRRASGGTCRSCARAAADTAELGLPDAAPRPIRGGLVEGFPRAPRQELRQAKRALQL